MTTITPIATLLTNHAIETYGDEIDLIGYYGSQARGDARPDSDLDIFYTPKAGKNPPVYRSFLLNDRLVDFWPIEWTTLQGFATGDIRGWAFAPALVAQIKILHARSDEQKAQLARIQQQTRDLQKPEARPHMVNRALSEFTKVQSSLVNLQRLAALNNLSDVRYAGWKLIEAVWECLALANQVYFERGLVKSLGETETFRAKPEQLSTLIERITRSPVIRDVATSAETLVSQTRAVLHHLQQSIRQEAPVAEQFQNAYPELKDAIRKVITCCADNDASGAHAAAYLLQHELAQLTHQTGGFLIHSEFNPLSDMMACYAEFGFPDLLAGTDDSLDDLARLAKQLDAALRHLLIRHHVDLVEFQSIDDLRDRLKFETHD